jgi:sulfonate transport system substrate-binding protein
MTRSLQMTRRSFAALTLAMALTSRTASAADKTIRIGFQKYGTLILLKAKGTLERQLDPLGYNVTWAEFPGGPQLLEALNAGAIDVGSTGEAPPIFAQAAGAGLVYFAHEPPAPLGEAIVVPKDSDIQTIPDLKGRKIVLNKGSNVHYLLVRALEKAGVAYSDVHVVFLPPADARAAFERGAVDAWAIWDPFLAAAEAALGVRTIATGQDLVPNHQFYLASTRFNNENPKVIDALVEALDGVDRWATGNSVEAAETLSASTGIPAAVLRIALGRQSYGVQPLDAHVVAQQQQIADAFSALGLLPAPIVIADAVRKPSS